MYAIVSMKGVHTTPESIIDLDGEVLRIEGVFIEAGGELVIEEVAEPECA